MRNVSNWCAAALLFILMINSGASAAGAVYRPSIEPISVENSTWGELHLAGSHRPWFRDDRQDDNSDDTSGDIPDNGPAPTPPPRIIPGENAGLAVPVQNNTGATTAQAADAEGFVKLPATDTDAGFGPMGGTAIYGDLKAVHAAFAQNYTNIPELNNNEGIYNSVPLPDEPPPQDQAAGYNGGVTTATTATGVAAAAGYNAGAGTATQADQDAASGYNATSNASPALPAWPVTPRAGLRTAPDEARVYFTSLIPTIRNDGAFLTSGVDLTQERPVLNPDPQYSIGNLLGAGGVTHVYRTPSETGFVAKVVSLSHHDGTLNNAQLRQVKDQAVGRRILSDVKAILPNSPFRITEHYNNDTFYAKTTQQFGTGTGAYTIDYHFAISYEEDISSQVTAPDGSVHTVTNAEGRLHYRTGGAKDRQLELGEIATVQKVLRDLNSLGIVWMDQKRANHDIVKDPTSETGYRMIFFDFDAFRPVQGDSKAQRARYARRLQAYMDGVPTTGLGEKYYKQIRDTLDFRAFNGDTSYSFLYSPYNLERKTYQSISNMAPLDFDRKYRQIFNLPPQ